MASPIAATVDDTIARLQTWVGREVVIEASLSRVPSAGHDRHFATSTQFAMRLEFVGARFSGSALMFEGRQGGGCVLHEVSLDATQVLEFVAPDHLAIVERFGPGLERQTTVSARVPEAEPGAAADRRRHSGSGG
jgi:hypothetical protein